MTVPVPMPMPMSDPRGEPSVDPIGDIRDRVARTLDPTPQVTIVAPQHVVDLMVAAPDDIPVLLGRLDELVAERDSLAGQLGSDQASLANENTLLAEQLTAAQAAQQQLGTLLKSREAALEAIGSLRPLADTLLDAQAIAAKELAPGV